MLSIPMHLQSQRFLFHRLPRSKQTGRLQQQYLLSCSSNNATFYQNLSYQARVPDTFIKIPHDSISSCGTFEIRARRHFSAWRPSSTEVVQKTPAFVPAVANGTSRPVNVLQEHEEIKVDLSCLFQSPEDGNRSRQHRFDMTSQKYRGLLPEHWIRSAPPPFETRLFNWGIGGIILLAVSVHVLPEMGMYDLARDTMTLIIRTTGLTLVSQCGAQMGLNHSRYGWASKLTRFQTMADFTARDACYLSVLIMAGLTLLDYVCGKKKLQPQWFFSNMLLVRISFLAALLLTAISERCAFSGRQIELIKSRRSRPLEVHSLNYDQRKELINLIESSEELS